MWAPRSALMITRLASAQVTEDHTGLQNEPASCPKNGRGSITQPSRSSPLTATIPPSCGCGENGQAARRIELANKKGGKDNTAPSRALGDEDGSVRGSRSKRDVLVKPLLRAQVASRPVPGRQRRGIGDESSPCLACAWLEPMKPAPPRLAKWSLIRSTPRLLVTAVAPASRSDFEIRASNRIAVLFLEVSIDQPPTRRQAIWPAPGSADHRRYLPGKCKTDEVLRPSPDHGS
jgi:hypothetical protein